MATAKTVVLAGTRKGLFVYGSRDRRRWSGSAPSFAGVPVHHAVLDPRDGKTIWAAVNSMHWGPTVVRSTDLGKRWHRPKQGPTFPKASGLSVAKVWHVAPGTRKGEVWAGVEPGGLFRSGDNGATWESVEGLNARPDRTKWMPGGGGLCLHTILPYPDDPDRMVVAISAAGVFGTNNGGKSWRLMNGGVRGDFMPEGKASKEDALGICPHKLVRDPTDPAVLFMQHHGGIYRRRRGDDEWTEITRNLPSRFGFPLAAHPRDPGTLYAVPLEGDFNRVVPKGAFAVWRTRDSGKRWRRLAKGLPQEDAWLNVLREGVATDDHDPAGVYVGTTTGELYASRDEGERWATVAEHLPQVMSVSAGVLSGSAV
ncbi:MAG: WD40/YVTN/BNR-like repeat-containing protein [Methanobacteriota archaeon]